MPNRLPWAWATWLRHPKAMLMAANDATFRFILFGVFLTAILPFALYAFLIALFQQGPPSLKLLSGQGQLWVLAIAILLNASAQFFDIIDSPRQLNRITICFAVGLIALIMMDVIAWASLANRPLTSEPGLNFNDWVGIFGGPSAVLSTYAGLKLAIEGSSIAQMNIPPVSLS